MKIGLNYTNTFVLDNGMILEIDEKGAFISKEKVLTGEIYVDGFNVGQSDLQTIEDRRVLGEDGVIVIGATVSVKDKKITFGPDIQTRGLIFVKDSEALVKEMERVTLNVINEELAKPAPSLKTLEVELKDQLFKLVKRVTLKSPMIITMINDEK